MPLCFVYPHRVYPFICQCTVGLFLPIGSVNVAAVTLSTRVRHFLHVYTQKRNRWIVWSVLVFLKLIFFFIIIFQDTDTRLSGSG